MKRDVKESLLDLVDAMGDEEFLNPLGHKVLVCRIAYDVVTLIQELEEEIENLHKDNAGASL